MAVLLLGSRIKYESFVFELQRLGKEFYIFEAVENLKNNSKKLKPHTQFIGYENFFNPDYYKQELKDKNITQIVNFRDQSNWLKLEKSLCKIFNTKNSFDSDAFEFFSYKSKQDQMCKQMNIDTIDSVAEKIIVKKDAGFSGGTGFYITEYKDYVPQENDFVQKYIDIDYTLNCQFYADMLGDYHILNYHKLYYKDNCPYISKSPYNADDNMFINYLTKLKQYINIRGRIMFWKLVKQKNGKLYNMDFNCRPAGGFENGSYDTDVSDCNWSNILLTDSVPQTINYHTSVTIEYKTLQTFGYGDYRRIKTPIKLKRKVIKL